MSKRVQLSEVKLTKSTIFRANLIMEWMLLFGMGWVKWDDLKQAGIVNMVQVRDKLHILHSAGLCTHYNNLNDSVRLKAVAPKYMKRIRRLQAKEGLI